MRRVCFLMAAGAVIVLPAGTLIAAPSVPVVALPAGVRAVWDERAAWRETTPTRERISLNGLWNWAPATNDAAAVPAAGWGWFKVPGCWPGLHDYNQNESQTLFANPAWKDARIDDLTAAWYRREVGVPAGWKGRRITLGLETLNSFAAVYVDGGKAGEITFPGGELDVSAWLTPGSKHVVSLLVIAMPLKAVMMSYADSAHAKEVRGEVEHRGLCGDAWLTGTPAGPRATDVGVGTSVRKGEISFEVGLAGLDPAASYRLRARVVAGEKVLTEFRSAALTGADLKLGRWSFTASWKPEALWDTDTPEHQLDAQVTLESGGGQALDAAFPVRFGFRELWIEGRDLILNGSRIHVSAVPEDNTAISTLAAGYANSRETFARLKASGFNAVYSHNYGTEPGTHLAYGEFLRAADDAGMLVFFALPHFGQYDWKAPDADATNGYARHAAAYVSIARNHPAVVMYAMSHNGAGYEEDMNPDLLGNGKPPRNRWAADGAAKALRAESIVHALDPTRVVYHHSAGDLGAMDTINFYGNQMPAAEMAEWMEPWAAGGVKPVFLCEFGSPLTWDWAMYRGWYAGQREFGSAPVPWEFCVAEWNAQYLGDRAYRLEEPELRDLRWEAEAFRSRAGWHRWDYPVEIGSHRFTTWNPIFANVLTAQLRGLRTSGLSGYCLWDEGLYWNPRDDLNRDRRPLPTDWDTLQRPGFSADFADASRYESWRVSFDRSDWTPTEAGAAIIRNSRPLLAWLAGSASGFTSAEHNYAPGETVVKQLIVINDTRRRVSFTAKWSCALPVPAVGSLKATVGAGEQARLPVNVPLPADLADGQYAVSATVTFSTGEVQADVFTLDVMAAASTVVTPTGRVALYDPEGETAKILREHRVEFERIEAGASLAGVNLLIIGRKALSVNGPVPDLTQVRAGLKVVVFEQTSAALEQRLGFRVVEYGLRQVFRRLPDHPALAGLTEATLHDWRGVATLLPSRLTYDLVDEHGPTIPWCGIPVSRVWRCGCRGNVASVLIEKPVRGDFLPLVDGGFDLQYSPLLEYREGAGMILFCQLDVTRRTEKDPAAARLVRNLLGYVATWKPMPRRTVAYAGEPGGSAWLASAGIRARRYTGGQLNPDEVLVVGPGAKANPPKHWLETGGRMVGVGLDGNESNAVEPAGVRMNPAEHMACVFDSPAVDSALAGVGPADVHSRDPRTVSLVAGGPQPVGDGVLATGREGREVFAALAPWRFDPGAAHGAAPRAVKGRNAEHRADPGLGLRRTYRRSSFMLARVLANQGAAGATPLLERFAKPVAPKETRYLSGLYLDQPIEWDDPYRFFRW